MNQADFFKLTMSVDEAQRVLGSNAAAIEFRSLAYDFASELVHKQPTPAEAQAVLVLAWNAALSRSRLIHPKD